MSHTARWAMLCAVVGIAALGGCAPTSRRFDVRTPIADTTASAAPLPIPDTLLTLVAGQTATCVTTSSGAGYCWGDIGLAEGQVYRMLGPDREPARLRSLAPALWSACGLTFDGELWCDRGLSGAGPDSSGVAAPRPACAARFCLGPLPSRGALPAGPVRALVRGYGHACAIGSDKAAYCLGQNNMGQLGIGTWSPDSGHGGAITRSPVAVVGGLRFSMLSAGEDLTCGITLVRGLLYCWGYGQSGETGDSTIMQPCGGRLPYTTLPCSASRPTRVFPDSLPGDRWDTANKRFVAVAVGMRLACAVSDDGRAYCWGGNYRCALGRCRMPDSHRAQWIPISGRVVEIGAGYWHACARTADGRVFCWGDNSEGQLGSLVSANAGPDGLPPDYRDRNDAAAQSRAYRDDPCFQGGRCSPAAVEVSPGRRWAALAVGPEHSCALAVDDGGVYCWGGTDSSVLGTDARMVPCPSRSVNRPDVRCQPMPVRVAGLPSLAAPPLREAKVIADGRGPLSETVVEVSARRIRVIFPVDTSGSWGWPARSADFAGGSYSWGVQFDGLDGPAVITAVIPQQDSAARAFPSLEALIAEARPSLCVGGWGRPCRETPVAVTSEHHRVTLTVSDSGAAARLAGLRPVRVRVYLQVPDDPSPFRADSVPVTYVDPEIPLPDSATRAEAIQGRRRYERSITTITRRISSDEREWYDSEPIWLARGDSVSLHVDEIRCSYDTCGSMGAPVSDSGWTVGDPRILRLHSICADSSARARGLPVDPCPVLYGRREGRTFVRVTGVHGPSDSVASSSAPERTLTRTIVVGRPVARIAFTASAATRGVVVGQPVVFRVRAFDRAGSVVPDVPVRIMIDQGRYQEGQLATQPRPTRFEAAGRRLVTASFRGLADTVIVMVVARPPR